MEKLVYPFVDQLLGFLDGSVPTPSPNVTGSNGITQVNPAYISWLTTDQTLLSLLYSSLTEESMGKVLGLIHAHEALTTLEAFFFLTNPRLENSNSRMSFN